MWRYRLGLWLSGSLLAIFAIGCGASTAKDSKTKTAKESKLPEPEVGGPNEIVKKFDLNRDKRADLWKVYVNKFDKRSANAGGRNLVMIRTEMDFNGDGKIDLRRYYKAGIRIREDFDLDFDGRFDLVAYYQQGLLTKQAYFLRSKTKPDLFKYFEIVGKKKKKRAVMIRKERDTNLDGRVDYWEYWVNGSLDRIGRDTDFDGNVDVWERNQSNQ